MDNWYESVKRMEDMKNVLDDSMKDLKSASECLGEYIDILKDPLGLIHISNLDWVIKEKMGKFNLHMLMAANKLDALSNVLNERKGDE